MLSAWIERLVSVVSGVPLEVLFIIFAVAGAVNLTRVARWSRRRLVQLELADRALDEHFKAMHAVVTARDIPPIIVQQMMRFSESLGDERLVAKSADMLRQLNENHFRMTDDQRIRQAKLTEAFDELERSNPKLLEMVDHAILTALVAMSERWPSLAEPVQEFLMFRSKPMGNKAGRTAKAVVTASFDTLEAMPRAA